MANDHERRISDLERQVKAVSAAMRRLSDAMTVQGGLQWRTDRNLAELTQDVRDLTDNQAAIQAALQSLIQSVDRFISGQSGNGRRTGTE